MAKNVVNLREGDGKGEGGEGGKTIIRAIAEKVFAALHRAVKAARAGMDSERATIGGLISDAVTNKYLHKGAYGIFCRLDKMDDYKRAELLFHLDLYRERAKWNESDLFRTEAAE